MPLLASTPTLPAVLVTASRLPTPSSQNLNQQDMHDYRYVNDVLQTTPGLTIRSNGYRGTSSIFIRGCNSEHTTVVVDGMEMNDMTTPAGSCDSSMLGLEGSKRLVIQRGPGSSADDIEGLAGIVSLQTERGSGPLQTTLTMEGGSFNSYYQSFQTKGSSKSADYNVSVFHEGTNGIVTKPCDLRVHSRQNETDPSNRYALISRTGYEFNDQYRMNIFNRFQRDKKFFADVMQSKNNPAQVYLTTTHMHKIELERYGESVRSSLSYGLSLMEHDILNETDPIDLHKKNRGETHTLSLKNHWELNDTNTFQAHFKWNHHQCNIRDDNLKKQTYKMHDSTASVGHQFTPNDWLHTDSYLRFHHDSREQTYITYKMKGDITIKDTVLTLSGAHGQKAPSLSQLYTPLYGNPSLKPEKSNGYDIGIMQALITNSLFIGTTYFSQIFSNLILADPAHQWQAYNIGTATTNGVESFIVYKPTAHWKIRLDHTYLHTKDHSKNTRLPRRPLYKLGGSLTFEPNKTIDVGIQFHTHGKELDFDERAQDYRYVKGRWIWSLWGNWHVESHPNLRFYCRIENATAARYEKPCGYNAAGFSSILGLKITINP